MRLLPFKHVKVTEGLYVRVSKHFYYTDFGVRDSGEMRYYGRRYISPATPGTGFFEHESESHSYHQFVKQYTRLEKPSYWRYLFGREPSYKRERVSANQALTVCEGGRKREILDCYVNALAVGENAERIERVVRGVKDKMGHKSNKFMVSVISHYKTKLSHLGNDMTSVEFHLKNHYSPETLEAYRRVVEAFVKVAACRRIWHQNFRGRGSYRQVFFDLGIFDFIRSDTFLPVIRDSQDVHYYLLPDSIIVARSSTDFDLLPIKDMTIVSQELAIEETVENLSSQLGDAASMIRIPELNLTYYFNHVRPIVEFVHAIDMMKETL